MALDKKEPGCEHPAIVKMNGVLVAVVCELADIQLKWNQLLDPQFDQYLLSFFL
jgi:hypothetical protein